MPVNDEQPEAEAVPAHDDRIGAAYVAGIVAARESALDATKRNPYYRNTEEWIAYRSGWRDETARRRRSKAEKTDVGGSGGDDGSAGIQS